MLSLPYILRHTPLVISLISLFAQPRGSVAAVSNRTIDDTLGDSVTGQKPVFLPDLPEVWGGPDCTFCWLIPDKTKAFGQTYNTATYRPDGGYTSIGLNFKGTAVYVFFIVANTPETFGITTLTECNFTMDGKHAGYYRHDPTPSKNIMYNVLVFQSENLPNTNHMLNISTSGLDYQTYTAFDYAVYTFDDSVVASPVAESPNPPTIQPPLVTSTKGTSTSNPAIGRTSMRPTNKFTTGSGSTAVDQLGAATPSQGENQGSSTVTSTVTEKPPPIGAIVGGSVGGFALIVFALLFMLYRRQKRIYGAKLTTPGHGTMVVTPFSDYGPSHPNTISTTSMSLTASMVQHLDPGAQGHMFPLSGYINPNRDIHVHAGMDSPESSGDGTNHIVGGGSPVWHWRRWTGEARNAGSSSNSSLICHDLPLVSSDGPVDVVAPPMDGGRQSRTPQRADLERQLREMQEEMRELMERTNNPRSSDSLAEVRMREMQEYIVYLQGSAGPPPEYATAITERRVGGA